jgi:MHS family proline/betaine transporter-like MFS transporter
MPRRSDPLLKIALTANLFEWYEFSLTAFMALEIGRLFFPAATDKTALMLSFSVFASSYLARPFGSLFFGALGNRLGAGAALKASMIAMAVPASLIALLPTYQTAGYLATALLIGLKLLQGFAAGGETPLSGYVVSLNAAHGNRGIYCAWVVVSGFIGMLLASAVVFALPYGVALLSSISGEAHSTRSIDAWRWPFLLCAPLSLWIYSLRKSIPNQVDDRACPTRQAKPILPLVQAAVLVAFMEVQIYTIFIWLPSYLHSYLGISQFDARSTNVITFMIFSSSMLAAGYATRWIDASKLVLAGIASLTLTSYPLFAVLQRGDYLTLVLAQAAFALMAGCLVGVIFVVLPDLFRDNWRSFGMTSTYSLSTAIFGGTTPLMGAYLIKTTGWLAAPGVYLVAMGLLAVPVALHVCLTRRGENRITTSAVDPAESAACRSRPVSSSIP